MGAMVCPVGKTAMKSARLLAVIGLLRITKIDDVLRPYILGKRAKMPYLFLFFSVPGRMGEKQIS